MDERDVQKKLEEIKRKREAHKEAALATEQSPSDEPADPGKPENAARRDGVALTEEEIEKRMTHWRESTDPTCEECGICSPDQEPDKAD